MDETELGVTQLADPEATGRVVRDSADRLRRGDALGRYVVIDVLGAGGMGVVYSAYDPDLGRAVAIKLLHPGSRGELESLGRGRLLREAQALAQLQHPNVITVHDVGEHGGQVFVAMEQIDGVTLRRWLDDGRRPWREILDVMLAAGRGLRAAHAKGMVHRDFKPDNVMLATDESGAVERILVMDFGLATAVDSTGSAPQPVSPSPDRKLSASVELVSLTKTGAVMGTPAYMAPEQHLGRPADDRTDQFSFCATLFEALYGYRPFAGDSVFAIVAACTEGRIEPPARGSGVPRWLHDAVRRGLAAEPHLRWPSMAALLEALQRDPTRARRWLLAGTGVVLLGGLAYGGSIVAERQRLAQCQREADAIDEVWNEEERARAEAGVQGTELSYAADTWERLQPRLDERAEQWRRLRYESCATPPAAPSPRPELMAAMKECFDESRAALGEQVELLARADAAVVDHALSLVTTHGRATPCADPFLLRHRAPALDDDDTRRRVTELTRELGRASLLLSAGRFDDAFSLATEVVEEADALGDARTAARARFVRGDVAMSQGDFERAEEDLEEAFFAARSAGADALAARTSTKLTGLVGYELARASEGRRWARHARVLADQADLDETERARGTWQLGLVELQAGDYIEALERLEEALAVFERELGPDSLRAINVLKAIATVHDRLGDAERAIAILERVLARTEETYGPEHPGTAEAYNNVGAAMLGTKDIAEARAHLERAVAIYDAADLQIRIASPLANLVYALRASGEDEAALRTSLRVLELRRQTRPPDHPDIADALFNHGQVLIEQGRLDEASEALEEALRIYETTYGPEHLRVGDGAKLVGFVSMQRGELERAMEYFERSLGAYATALPAGKARYAESAMAYAATGLMLHRWQDVLDTARPVAELVGDELQPSQQGTLYGALGHAALEVGRLDQAVAWLERAAAKSEDPAQEPINRAQIDLTLARARWAADRDRDGALELARDATDRLRELPGVPPGQLAEAEQWLAEHDR